VDPEQFANRDEVFEEMEVDLDIINKEIMDQDSDKEMLSDDTGYTSERV